MKKIKNKYTQPVQGTKRLTYVRLTIYLFDLFIYASHCLAFYLFIFRFRFFFWGAGVSVSYTHLRAHETLS
jgi:hypothetical protein